MLLRVSLRSPKIIKNTRSLRCLSISHFLNNKIQAESSGITSESSEKWTIIYKLPQIRLFSTANKIKIHQGILTALLSPLSWVAESSSALPEGAFTAVTTIGVTGFLSLTVFSLLMKNVVGFIYLDDVEERIKLAYVGFLGQRREAEYSVRDVISADDLSPMKYKLYYPLAFRGVKDNYIVFYKGGFAEDVEKFGSIFGYSLI